MIKFVTFYFSNSITLTASIYLSIVIDTASFNLDMFVNFYKTKWYLAILFYLVLGVIFFLYCRSVKFEIDKKTILFTNLSLFMFYQFVCYVL